MLLVILFVQRGKAWVSKGVGFPGGEPETSLCPLVRAVLDQFQSNSYIGTAMLPVRSPPKADPGWNIRWVLKEPLIVSQLAEVNRPPGLSTHSPASTPACWLGGLTS